MGGIIKSHSGSGSAMRVVPVLVVIVSLTAAAQLFGAGRSTASPHRTGSALSVHGGGLIAFTSTRSGDRQIFAMNPDGSGQTNLSNDPGSDDFSPAWSPVGTRIAFVSARTGDQDIWVMSADGSAQTDVTNDPGADYSPTWSPDGTQIAFASDRSGNSEIWTMGADGSNLQQFTSDPGTDDRPAWSPDGATMLWTSDRTGDNEIFEQNADGTGFAANLTNDAGKADDDAAWSPDGSTVAFDSDRGGTPQIYLMNPDGSAQTRLTATSNGAGLDPVFAPDQGSRVAFELVKLAGSQIGLSNLTPARATYGLTAVVSADPATASEPSWQPLPPGPSNGAPIQHVVILFQENHSFDNVLGALCVQDARCDGTSVGYLHDGTAFSLTQAADLVPNVLHSPNAQRLAVAGGQMNGFDLIKDCGATTGYACYTQYSPDQIPNLTALVRSFAISDRTFENDLAASWAAHLQLATAVPDGFSGYNPKPFSASGWGCDSLKSTTWRSSVTAHSKLVPSCVPFPDGTGPFEATPVAWVPTIMDRLDQAGLPWKLYAPAPGQDGYGWAVCPSFSECIYGSQQSDVVPTDQFLSDAASGTLPTVSLVIPTGGNSQHNLQSMLQGDNWIGQVSDAIMNGPEWASTSLFVSWDDCGCFYDHVPPPPGMGIRVPMVIVSPYARSGFTDSADASFASMLAYIEHTFGLAPLSSEDAGAYDFSNSFDYSQAPHARVKLSMHAVPPWEKQWMRWHPPDPDDPT